MIQKLLLTALICLAAFANSHLYEECEKNDFLACGQLGDLNFELKSYKEAFGYYQKACEGGVFAACSNLGTFYRTGVGVKKDLKKAYELYQKACEAKVGSGCLNLAAIYYLGEGVSTDYKKAQMYFKISCDELHYSQACFRLGIFYLEGPVLFHSKEEGYKYLSKACILGDKEACKLAKAKK